MSAGRGKQGQTGWHSIVQCLPAAGCAAARPLRLGASPACWGLLGVASRPGGTCRGPRVHCCTSNRVASGGASHRGTGGTSRTRGGLPSRCFAAGWAAPVLLCCPLTLPLAFSMDNRYGGWLPLPGAGGRLAWGWETFGQRPAVPTQGLRRLPGSNARRGDAQRGGCDVRPGCLHQLSAVLVSGWCHCHATASNKHIGAYGLNILLNMCSQALYTAPKRSVRAL